jgi:3-oxoacyl-[acyl-carrier protein] reductase
MIAIRGHSSSIALQLVKMLKLGETVCNIERGERMPYDADRYLFCAGVLRNEPVERQTDGEISESFRVNCAQVIAGCERIIKHNPRARICVIGSESGFAGSFDGIYAAGKAGLHRYVETRRLLSACQQLVCVAPGIIEDSGMTRRRTDMDALKARVERHPKRRFLKAEEVARVVHFLLYVDQGYITNQVIRMNGGEHLAR